MECRQREKNKEEMGPIKNNFQDCRFRRSMELFTGSTRKNTIYEAGSGWSCYERWGIFVTQNTDDLLDEKLKNNLGLKFAFRSTDLNEIKKTLAFFGVDPEDENNQKRLRDLENGQCLISDLYGRVGVIQFHPVFEELLHAFDTRPPVRKEV